MRLPNGFGSVVHLKGNRRNPFAARKTRGFDERGYPVYEIIGYFPTRDAGLIALANYNKEPFDINTAKITLSELFALWLEKKAGKLGESNRSSLKSAFKHCKALHNMRYKDIKSFHMQDCVDNCGRGYSTQGAIKNLFGHLDKFALELDIINRCYSDLVKSEPIPETDKIPFTEEELSRLWAEQDIEWVDSILVFHYTGFRISELLAIRTENIDLEERTIRGGLKTEAGKNRLIPIHPRIEHIIRRRVADGKEYLFTYNGKKVSKSKYYEFWDGIMVKLEMTHTPHECRHTFRSRLDSAGSNKKCIDMLMGHKSKDIGERVYTHKTIEELREAIELLK